MGGVAVLFRMNATPPKVKAEKSWVSGELYENMCPAPGLVGA